MRHESLGAILISGLLVGGFMASMLVVEPGFFWRDDFQMQYLPVSREIASATAEGSWPLLARSSWFGGALAGEYQHGVFSPVSVLVDRMVWSLGLELPATAAAISAIYLVLLWLGAYHLARSYRLPPGLAHLVALVSSCNGWMLDWGAGDWIPALRSFVWLPWFWWALRRAENPERGPWRFVPAGLFLALLLTSGWPMTVLMAALLSAWIVLCDLWRQRTLQTFWVPSGAWLVGLGLAAPALFMLVEMRSFAARGAMGLSTAFSVPPAALGGLVLPAVEPSWNLWGSWTPHLSAELAGGWIPLVGLVAGWIVARQEWIRRFRGELLLLLVLGALMMAPSFGAFRFSFRWLPFFHLMLALVGAAGLETWAAQERAGGKATKRWSEPLLAGGLVLATCVGYGLAGILGEPGLRLALGSLGLAFVWWLGLRLRCPGWAREALPAGVAACSLLLTYWLIPVGRAVPVFQVGEGARQVGPLEPEVRYLSVYRFADLGQPAPLDLAHRNLPSADLAGLRPANVPMLAGIDAVGGYSPLGPAGLARRLHLRVHGDVEEGFLERWQKRVAPRGLLQWMAVDGLLVAEGLLVDRDTGRALRGALDSADWRQVGRAGNALIFRRGGPPSQRVQGIELLMRRPGEQDWRIPESLEEIPEVFEVRRQAPVDLLDLEETRLGASVSVVVSAGEEPGLVLFARPWFPGYRARLETGNGEALALAVEAVEGILPAVRVPAGSNGRLVLEFRSRALRLGGLLALSTLAALIALGLWKLARGFASRREGAPTPPTSAEPRRAP